MNKKTKQTTSTIIRVPKWAKILCAGDRSQMKIMGEAEMVYRKEGRLILGGKKKNGEQTSE